MPSTLKATICSKCSRSFEQMEDYSNQLCLLCKCPDINQSIDHKTNPQEIIIKRAEISVNSHNLSIKNTPKPVFLNEFVGQEENKKSIQTTLKIIKQIKPINIFIHGYSGFGKSTLAEIIATELGAKFIYVIPEQLKSMEKISEVLNSIQEFNGLTLLMLDEAHNMDKRLINILLPILQDHKLGDVIIREFVMIMATTDYNKLYKKSEALISRFQTKIYLEKYSIQDIVTIIKQYKQKLNIDVNIPEKDYILIAENSKGIPREAINILLKRLVLPNMPEIFKENKIIFNGLNQKDIQILKCLNELTSPIGANFLSQRVGLIDADYQMVYEPFLVELGYIERTQRGRIISQKGKDLLKGV